MELFSRCYKLGLDLFKPYGKSGKTLIIHFFTDETLFAGQTEPQKFVVLEFSNGGEDLEHVVLKNAAQAVSVFWQVAFALAGDPHAPSRWGCNH